MKPFGSDWPRISRRLGAAKKKLLLLDFDGTLVSIARTPSEVRFRDRTQKLLRQLARRPDYRLAIISGRSLRDLKGFFRLKNALYVGNHGLEMSGGRLRPPPEARRARKMRFALWKIFEKMSADFYGLPGVLLEDKGLTLGLHFRNVGREHRPAFAEAVEYLRRHTRVGGHPLVWKKGKKVWEVVPKIRWHKGFAAAYLLRRHRGALPIVIGDDRTDEDMFKAMRRFGITVRVGPSRATHARYYLRSQREVDRLLEALLNA
ncbi:MAG TPA: trehalose-phosphatase [Candidatus Eisenbacteria bacterium]|nr:trehalose-phosphatase [Candidatus Eisenbacteria bacterium]